MIRQIVMPTKKKAMLASWLKQEGESIERGEPLFEIEADKVVEEVAAERAGVLKRLIVEEGDEVTPGQVIAEIEET